MTSLKCSLEFSEFQKDHLSLVALGSTSTSKQAQFSGGNHDHPCTVDLPTVRREGIITCHLRGKNGVVRTHAKHIVVFLNNRVETWC